MFNQDGWFFLVGAKGPYRCVYGPAGRFKATVTGKEEDGTRFMDGRWSAPTIIYRSGGVEEGESYRIYMNTVSHSQTLYLDIFPKDH